jgi:hypothetical protein
MAASRSLGGTIAKVSSEPRGLPMSLPEPHHSAAHLPEHVAAPIGPDEAAEALKNGPIGALVIASIAVGLLFIGWLAFYFFLFLPRGPIG